MHARMYTSSIKRRTIFVHVHSKGAERPDNVVPLTSTLTCRTLKPTTPHNHTQHLPDFQGGGCATLTDMYNTQSGSGPLYVLDSSDSVVSGGGGSASPTGRWLLTSGLQVLDDVTLYVHGTSSGGDADVLRIQVCRRYI